MATHPHVPQEARAAAHEAAPWVEFLARLGYAAKGVVYLVIGLLAARAAFGAGGATTDTRGAISRIGEQPFGQFLLAILSVGLVGYAVWQLVRAGVDPEGHGRDAKALAKRVGYAVSGVAYLALAYFAASRAVQRSALAGGGRSEEDWTATLLAQPFGRWLVALVALIVVIVALQQVYTAIKAKFMKVLNLAGLDETKRESVKRLGQVGIAARGVVLVIVGWFFAQAALAQDAQQAGGLAEALQALARQPYGPWLLGIVALGLAAFGVYAIIEGRYRKIHLD